MSGGGLSTQDVEALTALLQVHRGTPYETALKNVIQAKISSIKEKEEQPQTQPIPQQHQPQPQQLQQPESPPHHHQQQQQSQPQPLEYLPPHLPPSPASQRHAAYPTFPAASPRSTSSRTSAAGSSSSASRGRSTTRSNSSGKSRYFSSSGRDTFNAPINTFDDRWRARSASPPPRPFSPTLFSRRSSEKMLATSRAHETFHERVNRSVQNYYIRQAFTCFGPQDGPGQYTKATTVPYDQRFGPTMDIQSSSGGGGGSRSERGGSEKGPASPSRRPNHTWGSEKSDDSALLVRGLSERSFRGVSEKGPPSPSRRPNHTWGSEKSDDSALLLRAMRGDLSVVISEREGVGGRVGGSPRTRAAGAHPTMGSERSERSTTSGSGGMGSPRLSPQVPPYGRAGGSGGGRAFDWPDPSPATTSSDATTGVGQWSAGPASPSPDPRYPPAANAANATRAHVSPTHSPSAAAAHSSRSSRGTGARLDVSSEPASGGPLPHSPREQRLRHLFNLIMDVQRR